MFFALKLLCPVEDSNLNTSIATDFAKDTDKEKYKHECKQKGKDIK